MNLLTKWLANRKIRKSKRLLRRLDQLRPHVKEYQKIVKRLSRIKEDLSKNSMTGKRNISEESLNKLVQKIKES